MDKTLIVVKDGSLKTAIEYEQIPPDQNSLKLGELPYFFKISKIREIIYVSDGACTLKTYRDWRNFLYKAGYADPLLGTENRILTISELETVGRYFWDLVFGTIQQKVSVRNAMESRFYNARLLLELTHKPFVFSHTAPPGAGGGGNSKKQSLPENLLKKRNQRKSTKWPNIQSKGEMSLDITANLAIETPTGERIPTQLLPVVKYE